MRIMCHLRAELFNIQCFSSMQSLLLPNDLGSHLFSLDALVTVWSTTHAPNLTQILTGYVK